MPTQTTRSPAALARIPLERRVLGSALGRPAIEEARGPSPFIKWAGGKGRLMAQLTPLLPAGIERMRHVEPFMGGAAFFFARRPERALLCDVNRSLVDTYLAVQGEVESVIEALEGLSLAHASGDGVYYRVRERYNTSRGEVPRAERAAMFVYLNKTCFNGLHRVNRRGEFNVPEGRYESPRILDEDALRLASAALRRAEIKHAPFENLLESARPGDFVYLDPPYAPVSETASFTAYADEGFGHADQMRLRDVVVDLDRRGCRIMLSNSDVPSIRELYAGFHIDTVRAPRAISATGSGRSAVSEVVVRNY